MKKILSILFAAMMLFTSFGSLSATAYAANRPVSTSIKSVKSGVKSFTVKWKKKSGITGYQIQYSSNSKFKKNNKTIKIKKAKTTSKKITGLKATKKYFVRVRTYKGKKYSNWSKAKSVTTLISSNSYTVDNSTVDSSKIALDYIKCTNGRLVVLITNNNTKSANVKAQIIYTDPTTSAIIGTGEATSYCIGAGKTVASCLIAPKDSNYKYITDYNYSCGTVTVSESYGTDLSDYVSCTVSTISEGKAYVNVTNTGSPSQISSTRVVAVAYDANGNPLAANYESASNIQVGGMSSVVTLSFYDADYNTITPARVDVYLNASYGY